MLTKVPDAVTVAAGDPVGFTLTVTNVGAGTAKGIGLIDAPLPAGPDLVWSVDAAASSAGCTMAFSGTLICSFQGELPAAAGANRTVHITSPTSIETAPTILTNIATATAANAPTPATDQATITVVRVRPAAAPPRHGLGAHAGACSAPWSPSCLPCLFRAGSGLAAASTPAQSSLVAHVRPARSRRYWRCR